MINKFIKKNEKIIAEACLNHFIALFFGLLKMFLALLSTVLFTAYDWTMYPFSSQNEQDFRNLMSVYMDAAFCPLLRELDFW